MNKKEISSFKIGTTYVGVVVGAGFASGQEILRFYSAFSYYGLIGLCISTILFIILGYLIMNLGFILHAKSHLDILNRISGKHSAKPFDFIITFFLYLTFVAMISGSGAMMKQFYNIPFIWGCIAMTAITVITVISDFDKVITSISSVVPLLLICIFIVSIYTLISNPFNPGYNPVESHGLIKNWFISALLYVSYNIMFSISLLASLGAQAKDRKTISNGAILGGLGLGLGALFIYLALSTDTLKAFSYEIPMLYFSTKVSYMIGIIYSIVLVMEIYTTTVSNLYSFISRVTVKTNSKHIIIITAGLFSIIGCICSSFGFSNFVIYLYPIMGYCGFLLFIAILIRKLIKYIKKIIRFH